MKVKEKNVKCVPGVAQENLELNFDDKAISKLRIKKGNRKDFKFINLEVAYLKGLKLRYSPLTQKKIFYLKYRFKNKIHWLKLNEFILGHYGTLEVSSELLKLYKKYYKDGHWRHNPREQLITQRELDQSQELSVRHCIQRLLEAQFPRKTKIGRLSKLSQRPFARVLMGNHKRFDELIFDENKKGWGTIKLKNGLDWKSFWDKYPPENKDPKSSTKEISIYDTNNIGPIIIDHLTKGVIVKFLECRQRTPGTKENILDALQCLWGYAERKLKCFGDKTPPINPTKEIEILKDDDSHYVGSYLNEVIFDDDQMKLIDAACIRLCRKRPFQAEAIQLLGVADIRIETLLKLEKTDVKLNEERPHIFVRKEINKDRSRGKNVDKKVYINDDIQRVLDRLQRQQNRKCHERYKFIPWLFPSDRIDWGNPKAFTENSTRRQSLTGAWRDVRKMTGIKGSLKTLRKKYFSDEVELEKNSGSTTDEAIEKVVKRTGSHKGPKMIKNHYYKETENAKWKKANELSKVLKFKRQQR